MFRAAVAIEVLAIALVLLALFWDAPLEELADPMQTPNPAKAPWYFLGLQELLHYFPPVIAGVLIPTMVIVALIVIPYFNINVEAQGVWLRDKQRRMRIVGIVVGVLSVAVSGVAGLGDSDSDIDGGGFHVSGRGEHAGFAAEIPAVAGVEAAVFLDHDLVLDSGFGADHRGNVLPGRGLVLGLAVEGVMGKRKIGEAWQFLFGDSARAFGTLSVVLVLLLAVVPVEASFPRVGAVSEPIFAVDSPARRCRDVAAAFSSGIAANLVAGTGGSGPMHYLPRGDEGNVTCGCEHTAVPSASTDSALVDGVRMRDVPPWARRGHHRGGSAQQHEGMGTADSAGAIRRSIVRTVPPEFAHRNAATQRWAENSWRAMDAWAVTR